jgi:disulfide bond formation protein DsbB
MRINISLFLLLFSVLALASAYTSQYAFGMEPCILCLYQRIPYFVIIILSSISLFIKKMQRLRMLLVCLCGISLLVGGGTAFFHVGVERGIFSLTDGCEIGQEEVPSTLEEMTTQLMGKPNVPCDKPQFVFLGLSMAAWNFLFSSSFGLITLVMVYRIYKEYSIIRKSDEYREQKSKEK